MATVPCGCRAGVVRVSCGDVEACRLDVGSPQAETANGQRRRAECCERVVDARSVVGHLDEDFVALVPVADVGSPAAVDDRVRHEFAGDEPCTLEDPRCQDVVETSERVAGGRGPGHLVESEVRGTLGQADRGGQ